MTTPALTRVPGPLRMVDRRRGWARPPGRHGSSGTRWARGVRRGRHGPPVRGCNLCGDNGPEAAHAVAWAEVWTAAPSGRPHRRTPVRGLAQPGILIAAKRVGPSGRRSVSVLLPMAATRPTAWAPLSFGQLIVGTPDAPLPRLVLLGILHPADPLVASQRCDVPPRFKRRRLRKERLSQVSGQLVHRSRG